MKKISLLKLEELNKYLKSFGYIKNDIFNYSDNLTPNKLSCFLNLNIKIIEKNLKKIGLSSYENKEPLKEEKMQELLLELGFEFNKVHEINFYEKLQYYFKKNMKSEIKSRPIIVTVMGHVDHGKTTLIDVIRKSNLVAKETGEITQKICAYKVIHNNKKIIFIDTPGHEFFNLMRQRGTQITDIVVLVISGNENIKPQTIESIELAQKINIPVLVFVNKSDLQGYDIKNIKKELSKYELVSSEWGGKTIFIKGSAKNNIGVDELLNEIIEQEKIIKPITETQNLSKSIILDSFSESSGPEVVLIVKEGKLKIKDPIIVSNIYGCIKSIKDDRGLNLKVAQVGDCVVISGLNESPPVGLIVYGFESDQIVKTLSEFTIKKTKQKKTKLIKPTIDDLFKKVNLNKINIILKVDTKGTEEAVINGIEKFLNKKNFKNELKFISINIGEVKINDVKLADKTNSFILTFNLKTKPMILKELLGKTIKIFEYKLIYELLDKLIEFAEGKHIKENIINILGKMEVTNIFTHSKFGIIAGGYVKSGTISKSSKFFRVFRNKKMIIDKQKILTIRHEKNEIKVAVKKQSCGILFQKPFNFEIDDIVEQYEIVIEDNTKKNIYK